MAKKYLELVEIDPEFFSEVQVKVPVNFEEQAGSEYAFEFLQNHLRSKKLASRIEEKISLKAQADKELAKVMRSMERNKSHIDEVIPMEDLSKHYIKLRALVEKLRLKVPDIERIESYPMMNILVQQELMEKIDFIYEEETDPDSPLYEEMRDFTHSFVQTMKPLVVRPEKEDAEEIEDSLMLAMTIMGDPEEKSVEELIDAARTAIDISRYCMPAYIVLLEEAELSDMEKYALSEQGIKFSEEFFGVDYFNEFKARLASSPEGSNYMMIRNNHASALMKLEMYKEAAESMQTSLDYDEGDEFGFRYRLLTALTVLGDFKEARKLLLRYNCKDDVYWDFGKLLVEILEKGTNEQQLKSLKELQVKYPRTWELIQDEELYLSPAEEARMETDHKFRLSFDYAAANQELWWDLEL